MRFWARTDCKFCDWCCYETIGCSDRDTYSRKKVLLPWSHKPKNPKGCWDPETRELEAVENFPSDY